MRGRFFLFFFFPCILLSSTWKWEYISSENFDGYYKRGEKAKAIKGLYFLEKYKAKIDSLTGFSHTGAFNFGSYFLEIPSVISDGKFKQRIPIVFQDMGVANGYADPTFPKISLFHNGIKANEFVWGESWYRLVGVHEYTHIAQMSPRRGNLLATIFGYWLCPNIYQPLWILEGYTVYSESQVSAYEGRLNNGVFNAIAESQKFFGTTPTLESLTYHDGRDFPADAPYLYGGILTEYLSQTYGEKSLTDYNNLVTNQGFLGTFNIFFPNLFMNKAAKEVFGEDFHTLYKKAIANLPEIKIDTDLELNGLKKGNVQEFVVNDGICYYTVQTYDFSGASVSNLYRWDNGESEFVRSFPVADDYSFQLVGNELYYRKYVFKSGFANVEEMGSGVSRELCVYDLTKRKEKTLISENLESFFVDEQKNIYYTKERADEYGSELYLKKSGEVAQRLLTTDMSVSQLAFDEENEMLILTAKSELGSLGIYSWEVGESKLKRIINSQAVEIYPSARDGKLFFTANYNKKLGGYRYDLHNHTLHKITDAEFAKDVRTDGDFAYYLGLGKDGYRLCRDEIKNESVALPVNSEDEKLDISGFAYADRGGATTRNLASLLIPNIRTFFSFNQGSDLLGSTSYSLGMSESFFLNASTTFFDPFIISFEMRAKEFYAVSGYLPAYTSLDFGLSNLYFLLGYEFDDKKTPKDKESLFTGLNLIFGFPHDYLSVTSTYDDADNVDCKLTYFHNFIYSQLGFIGSVEKITDKDLQWSQMEKDANLFYLQKICDVKKGIWTPSVYLQDLNAKFFVEYDNDEASKNSYEMDTDFGVGLVSNILTLLGNLQGNLEVGSRWEKRAENKDYQPVFYSKILFSY